MCKRKAFTLIELLVVIAVIAVLMSILMPALHRAREQGKRIACQSNLKQMSLAWIMYAQENDGKIMKGTPGTALDNCWGDTGSNTGGTEQTRQAALMTGALWPYCANLKLYRCPTGRGGRGSHLLGSGWHERHQAGHPFPEQERQYHPVHHAAGPDAQPAAIGASGFH